MKIIYYGKLVKYKVLADQICDYFGHTLVCTDHTTDDDIVYPYSLWDIKGKLIAPTPYHSNLCDSKIWQYRTFEGHIPIPAYEVCEGFAEFVALLMQHKKKVFVTKDHSASGEGNIIYDGNLKDVMQFRHDRDIRVSEYIPHKHDVSLHLIILNKKQFFISSIVEQIIEGTVFKGGRFPININEKAVDKIHEYCEVIAEKLSDIGMLGYVV